MVAENERRVKKEKRKTNNKTNEMAGTYPNWLVIERINIKTIVEQWHIDFGDRVIR